MSIRCLGCMKLKENSPVCEHCGYNENVPNYAHQLPVGTVLREHYLVGKALGQGGFGITYIGWDQNLDLAVAIKEYYPNGIVNRESTHSLSVSTSEFNTELYQHNRERFLREARALARLSNVPGIVGIYNFFPENNTAYIIMEYVEGIDLKRYIRAQGRPLAPEEAFAVLKPVMDSLSRVHEAGLVHRDISPDNIMIQRDGRAKLLDFGAVREVGDAQLDKNLSRSTESILKHGYAPIEQYQRRGNLGPWTDVYALCATVYYCLTQETPPDAPERMIEFAEVEWNKIPGLSEAHSAIFAKGMAILPRDRYHSIAELRNALFPEAPEPKPEPKPLPKPVPEPEPEVALTVNAVVDATVISRIEEKKQEEIPPAPKAVQLSLEERRLKRKQEQLRQQQEKLEQQKKAQEEKHRREEALREQRRLEQEEKRRREAELQEQRRQQLLEKQMQEQEAKEQRKKAQLEKQRREAELREKRRLEQEEKLHREEEQKEQRRQKRLEEKQRKEAEKAGRSIHKILIPLLAVIAVMLTILLLMPKGEDGEQMRVQETVGNAETEAALLPETLPEFEPLSENAFLPERNAAECPMPNWHHYITSSLYSYHFREKANVQVMESQNLKITVVNKQDVTITVTGLDLQDSYPVGRNAETNQGADYHWRVLLFGEKDYSINTVSWAQHSTDNLPIGDMNHWLWEENFKTGAGTSTGAEVTVEYTSDSITWHYIIPDDHPFDFTKLHQIVFHQHDYVNHGEEYQVCRVYNPSTGAPSETSASSDGLCLDCGDWREDSVMYTYQTGTRNGKQFVEGENLSISVAGSHDVTVTLSGLDIRDSYPVNLSTTGKDMMEYGWHVTLHGEDTYRIGTSSWAFAPGQTETRTLDQMQNSLRDVAEDGSALSISNVYMDVSWDKTSITWRYIIPSDHPFDFTKLKQVSVHVDNIPEGIGSCWVYNPQVAQISAGVEDAWKDNVMMANPFDKFTDFKKSDIVTVTFLDSTENTPANCLDISVKQDGSVLAWAVDSNKPRTFSWKFTDVYIAANGGINAKIACEKLFADQVSLESIHFNNAFHTEEAMNMSSMFASCMTLAELDLTSFETPKVMDMTSMFLNCYKLSSLDISNLNTSKVTTMYKMFAYCESLDDPDLSSFNTTNVTEMSEMFFGCTGMKTLDISHFNTAKVACVRNMFHGCKNLETLQMGDFNISSVWDYLGFMDDDKTINGRPWEEFFEGAPWDDNVMMAHPFTDFDQKETVTTVTFLDTVKDAPEDCWDISYKQNGGVLAWMDGTELYIGAEGGIAAPEDCSSLFNGWKELKEVCFNGVFHTGDVTTMSAMFIGCQQLRTLDLSTFDTGKVTDMSSMFQNCFQLSSVNFSGVDTALVTDMNNMFTGCANLDELDLSGFDPSNVTSMRSMFLDCMSLKKLNLSGWNTGKVTDMTYMFRGCSWLSSVDVSNFDTSSVTNYKDFMDEGKTINGQPWEEFFEK